MSYYHPRKPLGTEDIIYKARQYENSLRDRMKFVHEYENMMRYAQFEELNGGRSAHRSLAEKLAAIRAQREQALAHRRHKLSALLTTEEANLRHEIDTGKMNLAERRAWLLSQALALSSHKAHAMDDVQGPQHSPSGGPSLVGETNLEKVLCEEFEEVSLHNSKLAVMQAEGEKKRQLDKENFQFTLHEHGLDSGNLDVDKHAIDILREHLYLVEQLRQEEKTAVEEDMISMNRRWLEEEENLKLQHLEMRHHRSLQAKDLLLHSGEEIGRGSRDDVFLQDRDSHMIAMVAGKEAQENKQLEDLKEAHKREAMAYVCKLKKVADRQRFEDEELEATIKAKLIGQDQHESAMFKGVSQMHQTAHVDEQGGAVGLASSCNVSKKDIIDVLEGQRRGLQAAELIDQQVKAFHCSRQGADAEKDSVNSIKKSGVRMKHPAAMGVVDQLPYPEPYYGRKAVKWYE